MDKESERCYLMDKSTGSELLRMGLTAQKNFINRIILLINLVIGGDHSENPDVLTAFP